MIHDIFMPALSSTMTEGKVVSWLKEPGDKVEKGETVLIVESDKADMDVESFYGGYLAAIATPVGAMAPVGAAIAYIAETEAEIAQAQAKVQASTAAVAPAAPAAAPSPLAATASSNGGDQASPAVPTTRERTIVSPRARKLAQQYKVHLM